MPLLLVSTSSGAVLTGAKEAVPPAWAGADGGMAIHQVPMTPSPFMSPAFLSLTKVYKGAPPNVSCLAPEARGAKPKVPRMPGMVAGTRAPGASNRGGQNLAH